MVTKEYLFGGWPTAILISGILWVEIDIMRERNGL